MGEVKIVRRTWLAVALGLGLAVSSIGSPGVAQAADYIYGNTNGSYNGGGDVGGKDNPNGRGITNSADPIHGNPNQGFNADGLNSNDIDPTSGDRNDQVNNANAKSSKNSKNKNGGKAKAKK